ncbi:MAG: 50S ribosomal protein L19e, partial [Thaumarchaeota archaeon]|nr:50S ribosomal protein L19e [Nitrososphaerota archaeon]
SRHPKKQAWVTKVRALRWRLCVARDRNEITKTSYRKLYRQIKGGQVRDVKRLLEMMKESKAVK